MATPKDENRIDQHYYKWNNLTQSLSLILCVFRILIVSVHEYLTYKALIFVIFSKVLKLLDLYIYTQKILNMYGNISYIDTVCTDRCLLVYF